MKKPAYLSNLGLLALSIVFSIALMFAFTELPRLLDSLLGEFPGMDHGRDEINAYKTDVYISVLHLRWIGYACLIIVLALIVIGFVTKRSGWGLAGAIVLFLPVFGNFALSMFFLAGLGMLRVGWLPFWDVSFQLMDLGNIIFLPYRILEWLLGLFNVWAQEEIGWILIGTGAFLFTWGVLVWMQSRFSKNEVATSWIYRFSRHPQYLGWIIWSYGIAIYSPLVNNMKKSWGMSSSLPLLLMIMIIIGMCMLEEIRMREKYGEQYDRYRNKTPFMFPLPAWLKRIIKFPMWLMIRKKYPEKKREVALIIFVYTLILIGLSLFRADIGLGKVFPMKTDKRQAAVYTLVQELHQPINWRLRASKFQELDDYGNIATPYIIAFLSDTVPENQENAAKLAGKTGDTSAIRPLLSLLSHPWENVRIAAINSLVELKTPGMENILLDQLKYESGGQPGNVIYASLARINAQNSWEAIRNGASQENPWACLAAVKAMSKLYPDSTAPYLIHLLQNENKYLVNEAVAVAMIISDERTLPYLETFLNEDIYEIRFFARQAIRSIEAKND